MKLKKIMMPLYIALLSGSLANAGTISQTLSQQLSTDSGRTQFNADLRGFLDGNDVVPLADVTVPGPPDLLTEYVDDEEKLIALGKALFWDVQVSTDASVACATCHNAAGADNRAANAISFGRRERNFDGTAMGFTFSFENDANNSNPFAAAQELSKSDFPRNKKADKFDVLSTFSRQTNTGISSAGVHLRDFTGFNLPQLKDDSEYSVDFFNSKLNTRRVRDRHVPTNINAVFNHRSLWNGLANNVFNGVTPFGPEDDRAKVFRIDNGQLAEVKVEIVNASLSSQSVGSPNNPFEMAAQGVGIGMPGGQNTFVKSVKRRGLLNRRPLAKQTVSSSDSVLGSFARRGQLGLNVDNYRTLIKETFKSKWWSSNNRIELTDGDTPVSKGVRNIVPSGETPNGESFSQIEMNFPLFFGLAIARYEAELVSEQTPADRYLAGNDNALTDQELIGFRLAANEARCFNCHGGGEFTFASVTRVEKEGITRNRRSNLIDEGFNNIAVTPTFADLGVGELGPNVKIGTDGKFTRIILSEARKELLANPNNQLTSGADGAFKIPTLRNVELTAPYFHNGAESTLEDVVDFYLRGGNYRTPESFKQIDENGVVLLDGNGAERVSNLGIKAADRNRQEQVLITGLGVLRGPNKDSRVGLNAGDVQMDDEERDAIVAFLKTLTDERVRTSRAPFDHPSLAIPVSFVAGDENNPTIERGRAQDDFFNLQEVGARGAGAARETFFDKLK